MVGKVASRYLFLMGQNYQLDLAVSGAQVIVKLLQKQL
jgi:hypothetical protein